MTVECTEIRTLLSSILDGDLDPSREITDHLETCEACRRWRDDAIRLAGIASVPLDGADRSIPVLDRLPAGAARLRGIRLALAWTGLLLVVWNLPGVFDMGLDVVALHYARHQHAFGVALGITFLLVAWRPDRAYGLVPVAATFTVALSISAIVDLMNGTSTMTREALHLIEIVGLAFLWVLGWSAGPGRRRRSRESERLTAP